MSIQSYSEVKNALKEEYIVEERIKYVPIIKGEILCQPFYLSDNYNKDYMTLQFHGWELVLLPDGTYFLNDTSG